MSNESEYSDAESFSSSLKEAEEEISSERDTATNVVGQKAATLPEEGEKEAVDQVEQIQFESSAAKKVNEQLEDSPDLKEETVLNLLGVSKQSKGNKTKRAYKKKKTNKEKTDVFKENLMKAILDYQSISPKKNQFVIYL